MRKGEGPRGPGITGGLSRAMFMWVIKPRQRILEGFLIGMHTLMFAQDRSTRPFPSPLSLLLPLKDLHKALQSCLAAIAAVNLSRCCRERTRLIISLIRAAVAAPQQISMHQSHSYITMILTRPEKIEVSLKLLLVAASRTANTKTKTKTKAQIRTHIPPLLWRRKVLRKAAEEIMYISSQITLLGRESIKPIPKSDA